MDVQPDRTMRSFVESKGRELERLCRRNGMSLTVQRRVVLEALAGRADHPSADQVYEAVRERIPGISRTTVFRVLETLVRLGVAKKVSSPGSAARFDADTGRHHHGACLGCGSVVDVRVPAADRLAVRGAVPPVFEVVDWSVTLTGYCPDCREKR
jgi:Fur family transcriptional regulator, peroxide stress response regulator